MLIREATPADNNSLLLLTSQSSMEGRIALRIDRHPDFFSLLSKRGESTTFVAEEDRVIIGCISVTKVPVWINKVEDHSYYVSDLKVEQHYRGSPLAFRLIKKVKQFLENQKADLVLVVVAQGNNKINSLLSGRLGIPAFHYIGTFTVYQFLPSKKKNGQLNYEVTPLKDSPEIMTEFNSFYKKYQLSKVINSESHGEGRILGAKIGNNLVAGIVLFDSSPYKQNVLIRVNPLLNFLIKISRFLPTPKLPVLGESIKTLYIKSIFYKEGHEHALIELIKEARCMAWAEKFHFVSVGVHTKDPVQNYLKPFFKFTFYSKGLIASLKGNDALVRDVISGIPSKDYSLV